MATVKEAAMWLSYTFLYVRLCRNSLPYGIPLDHHNRDPLLFKWRSELVEVIARRLDTNRMIRFHPESGSLDVTELGRTAARYYLTVDTVETFNQQMVASPYQADLPPPPPSTPPHATRTRARARARIRRSPRKDRKSGPCMNRPHLPQPPGAWSVRGRYSAHDMLRDRVRQHQGVRAGDL